MLHQIRVLDLTRLLPGAFCTMLLADMGVDVIKIEEPGTGDYGRWMGTQVKGAAAAFNAINRNKRSVTLNLKSEAGRELFKQLTARADAVVEGNRPGVMDRLGLGWSTLQGLKPSLVLCSITGYGQTGPFASRAGHDINYMAIAGALGLNSWAAESPHPLPVQVADVGAGAQGAATAILGALLAVAHGAPGRHLDVSMTDGALSWMRLLVAEEAAGGERAEPGRTRLGGGLPCYRVYRCADGRHLSLGALEPKFWNALCTAADRPDLLPLQFDQSAEAHGRVEEMFGSRPRDAWTRAFEGLDVCCEPVLDLDEVAGHPQIAARGLVIDTAAGREVAPAVPFGDDWRRLDPPGLGEHTAEVLSEVGVDAARLAELRTAGVV